MNISRRCFQILSHTLKNSNPFNESRRSYCYKSAYSLENLYPKSSLKLTTPQFSQDQSNPKFSGFIPVELLDIKYSTSSAPGGQNVNRVNTKVDLRFHLQSASWLSDDLKTKLSEQYKTRISKEGYFIVKSEVTRSQQLNLADALEKLRTMIRKVEGSFISYPTKETLEMLRKREMKASRERLLVKRKRSDIKQGRASVKPSDIF